MWNVVPPNAKILFAKIDSESMRFYSLQKFIFSENVFSLYKWVYYLLKQSSKYLTNDRRIWNLSLILIIQREISLADHNEQIWNND